jgi:DNA repair protein RadC
LSARLCEGLQVRGLVFHLYYPKPRSRESAACASINGANEIISIRVISMGLVDRSPVHPREVFTDALADRSSGVIVAHNHPSGPLERSVWDLEVTRQLKAAGEVLGVPLMDHIIFNRTGYLSLLEAGKL